MKSSIYNFFKDKKGNLVIVQKPNLLVFLATILFFVNKITIGIIQDLTFWGFRITIFIWSVDELLRGDSKFRKLLGALIGTFVILSIFNNL